MSLRVTCAPLSLSLRSPLATAHGEIRVREGWRVRIDAADCTGWGEALPLPDFGTESHAACERSLAAAAEHLETLPRVLPEIDAALEGLESAPAARFGLECALLDLMAKRHGMAVAQLLGGAVGQVPVNALLAGEGAGELAIQARAARSEGFRTVKLKVGKRSPEEDVARVMAVREAVGDGIRIRVDANGGWSAEQAIRTLGQLERVELELCEQPTAPRDLEALAQVRKNVRCRIAADEALLIPKVADTLLASGACDVLVLKPMALGGLLRTVALAQRARVAGIDAYVTGLIDGEIARAAAAHLACVLGGDLAHGLATGALIDEPPRTPWLVPQQGVISVPATAGLGVEVRA